MSPASSAALGRRPAPVIFGCAGLALTGDERRFFAACNPLGFILFARNIDEPAQVRGLVSELRDAVGRADAPIMIDQEGGRVARLRPPHWRHPPPAACFAELYRTDPTAAIAATRLNARLIAAQLANLGIDVDCAPVLDLPAADGHEIIGDRAFGATPAQVVALGRAVCDGLIAGGVLPVIKHIPGHGRARADSHLALPVVTATAVELAAHDFAPFRALNDMPWAMTAHVVYSAFDAAEPATTSARVIEQCIRGTIGFAGVLLSDDLTMQALSGPFADRARRTLSAGCDVVLHCSGVIDEMDAVRDGLQPMSDATARRLARAQKLKRPPKPFDVKHALTRIEQLLDGLAA